MIITNNKPTTSYLMLCSSLFTDYSHRRNNSCLWKWYSVFH